MTSATGPVLLAEEGPEAKRWLVAAALAAAAHAGVILWLAHKHDISAAGAPAAAIMIDLPAMDVAPASEAPPQPAEGPKMLEASPPAAESPKPMAVPELPPAQKPAVVLAPPPKPKAKPKKKEVPLPAKPALAPPAPRTSALKNSRHSQAARGQSPAQSRRGEAGSAASVATWRTEIYAHLLRHKPAGGEAGGVVTVSFRLAKSGALLGVRLAASSGSPDLDRRALEMVRSANPFPSAPSELAGSAFPFTVPVRFR